MKMKCLAVVLAALSSVSWLRAAELILAEKGKSAVPIVVAKGASTFTRDAANHLASAVEKMTGVRPGIIEGEPSVQPSQAIWIGVQPAVQKLFPGSNLEFQHPEEILLAANDKHVVIAGRDRWVTPEAQTEYGTVNAVYTFMQDQLGVRWLWPGELGEDVISKDRITIAPFEHRYHPQIRSREGVFHYSSLGNKGYGKSHEWALRQRLQLGSLAMEGGHGFGDWWERYHEKYPEIFALQPDGTRSGFPNPRTAKLCVSNPLVGKLWLEEVEAELNANPAKTVFNASPNDGWASGHCVCANCRAWDHPEGEPRRFNWYKLAEVHPALSDRDVTFANKMGTLLKAKYPEKDYRVLMLSYGHSRPAPVNARPADNVIMTLVANFYGRSGLVDIGSTRGDTYRDQFDAWTKLTSSFFWRPNTGSPAGWQQGLPDLSTQQTIRDLKDVAAAGCLGIYIDGVWEHWATMGPQYYVMAQLVWDSKKDGQEILADYYQRGFGPAAGAVRAYYEGIEKARMAFTAKNLDGGVFLFPELYTPELLEESQKRLEQAAAAVPAGSVYQRRVAFVRVGLDYTRLVMENVRLMQGYWKKKDEAVAKQVRDNWVAIEKLIGSTPYAINVGPVRPITPRMAGLHPDYPPGKQKKARAVDLDLN